MTESTYIPRDKDGNPGRNYSFTNSKESYQHKAGKEAKMLHWFGRYPTTAVVWHLLKEFSIEEIIAFRTKMFRYLQEHGIEAVASIELTRGANGIPNGRVHFHILIDDQRSKQDIRTLFNTAALRSGQSREEFRIDCIELRKPKPYIDYYAKTGKHAKKVLLFEKDTGLQKFYIIGMWFKEWKGGRWVKKSKKAIWNEIKEHMRNKNGQS